MNENYPPEFSVEDIKVKIQETSRNPNIRKTHQLELKSGPRTYRIATIFEIVDPAKKVLHHLSLQLDSFDKTKKAWKAKPGKRIILEGRDPDEIQALSSFLNALLSEHYPEKSGDFYVVPEAEHNLVTKLTELLPKLSGNLKLDLFIEIFRSLNNANIDIREYVKTFREASPEVIRNISVVVRYVEYQSAFEILKNLIDDPSTSESKLQNHLQKHPWIFGSEYCELLDRRAWTRDDNLDFMLRRTVDGYLEIIEIKTPFEEPLFRNDSSHASYYASSKLSQAIGQVFRYIEEVERKRDAIIASDKLDPLKIRARIIIGRDNKEGHQMALRSLNSHLHHVEIVTFDQLIRVGQRILDIFQFEILSSPEEPCDDNVPF